MGRTKKKYIHIYFYVSYWNHTLNVCVLFCSALYGCLTILNESKYRSSLKCQYNGLSIKELRHGQQLKVMGRRCISLFFSLSLPPISVNANRRIRCVRRFVTNSLNSACFFFSILILLLRINRISYRLRDSDN